MSNLAEPKAHFHAPVAAARGTASPRRLAVAVAFLFTLTSIFAYASPSRTFGWDKESFSSSSEATLVSLTNRARANAGLRSLRVDSTLTSVARWRSKDMINRDYFSHTIPGYGKVFDKLHAIGYCYKVAGENIGWNNYPDDIATAAIQDMFMNSSGHRANILGKTWDRIGIGAYKGPTGKKMWTVLFADKCGTTAPKPTPKPTAKPKPKPVVKAAPRPTPRPTAKPKPAPAATPVATPVVTGPRGEDSLRPTADPFAAPSDDGSIDSNESQSPDPGDGTEGDGTVGMRVVDDGGSDGLLQSIVGGVTGFFLGG